MSPLSEKIAAKRAQVERERRADLLEMGLYFQESAIWWFAEAAITKISASRDTAACRKAAVASATAAHLTALTLIALESAP
jgi:hypothetical protein